MSTHNHGYTFPSHLKKKMLCTEILMTGKVGIVEFFIHDKTPQNS